MSRLYAIIKHRSALWDELHQQVKLGDVARHHAAPMLYGGKKDQRVIQRPALLIPVEPLQTQGFVLKGRGFSPAVKRLQTLGL
jgi:hypothetical protein